MLIWDLKAGRNKSRQKKEEKGEEQVKKKRREEEKNNIINIPGHGICDFVSIGEAQQ